MKIKWGKLRKMLSSVTKKCSGVGNLGYFLEGELVASTKNPLHLYGWEPTRNWEEPASVWEGSGGEGGICGGVGGAGEGVGGAAGGVGGAGGGVGGAGEGVLWWPPVADPVSAVGRVVAGTARVAGTSGIWLFPSESLMDGPRGCSLGPWYQSGGHSLLSVRQDQQKRNRNPKSNMPESHTPFAFFLLLFPANTENIIKSGVGRLQSCDWCVSLMCKTFSSLVSSI